MLKYNDGKCQKEKQRKIDLYNLPKLHKNENNMTKELKFFQNIFKY